MSDSEQALEAAVIDVESAAEVIGPCHYRRVWQMAR